MADKIKVFVSWSGDRSKAYAEVVRAWLEGFDLAEPFMSDVDIRAGAQGMSTLIQELQGTKAVVVVVTAESMVAEWVNFEAGYVACMVDEVQRRVIPLLMDDLKPTDLRGPLAAFQGVSPTDSGLKKLVHSLSEVLQIDPSKVEAKSVQMVADWHSRMDAARIPVDAGKPGLKLGRNVADMTEEILTIVRGLREPQQPETKNWRAALDEIRGLKATSESARRAQAMLEVAHGLESLLGDEMGVVKSDHGFVVPLECLDEAKHIADYLGRQWGTKIHVLARPSVPADPAM